MSFQSSSALLTAAAADATDCYAAMTTTLPPRSHDTWPPSPPEPGPGPLTAGLVRPRRRWPGGRAALGGLLVAGAALVAFWAVRQAGATPQLTYLVAADDLAAGQSIGSDDIVVMSAPLDDHLAARTFRQTGDLIGGVVTRSVDAGQLIDVGDVAAADEIASRPGWELALGLETQRVAAETGDVVDIVASIGSGESATSEVVASGVRVQRVSRPDTFDGSTTEVVLGLDSLDQVLAVSRAEAAGVLFLVRANGAPAQ
jgi:SAF domain